MNDKNYISTHVKLIISTLVFSLFTAATLITFTKFGIYGGVERHPILVRWALCSLITLQLIILDKRYTDKAELIDSKRTAILMYLVLAIIFPLGLFVVFASTSISASDFKLIKHIRKKTRRFRYFIKQIFNNTYRAIQIIFIELIKPRRW